MISAPLYQSATDAWLALLRAVRFGGERVAPRGRPTRELRHASVGFPLRYPVVAAPARALGYRFMAAEARWILTGSDVLAEIAPWAPRMREFSDDGATLAGAYGPPYAAALPRLVDALAADPATRQAAVSPWREPPRLPTRDLPCTLAWTFARRGRFLHLSVFMRSSDLWLGTPYDLFTAAMAACQVAARLGERGARVELGLLEWTTASAHLYDENLAGADLVLATERPGIGLPRRLVDAPPSARVPARRVYPVPRVYHECGDAELLADLARLREPAASIGHDGARWAPNPEERP